VEHSCNDAEDHACSGEVLNRTWDGESSTECRVKRRRGGGRRRVSDRSGLSLWVHVQVENYPFRNWWSG